MEIDEDWQTQRRYMRMLKEDENLDVDKYFMREVNDIRNGIKKEKELVTL